jgi:transposase-like protein
MTKPTNPFRYFNSSPEVIRLAVMPYVEHPLSLRSVEDLKALQKFSSVHASVDNHFNQDRHLVSRETYAQMRSAALAEWRSLQPEA